MKLELYPHQKEALDFAMEEWKEIPDFPRYRVNTLGQVLNIKTGKILRGTICKDGYRKVNLTNDVQSKVKFVHRLVAIAFLDNLENKRTVNHIDGDKLNNNLANLEWATDSENSLHAFRLGLKSTKGIKNSAAKLTEKEVIEIKKLRGLEPQSLVAKRYNISKGHVSNIQRGYNWKDFNVKT